MPFHFMLPTPAPLDYQAHITSPTHPQLPHYASATRHAVRVALKRYNQATRAERSVALSRARTALEDYLPWLVALIEGAGCDLGRDSNGPVDLADVCVQQEVQAQWQPTLLPLRSRLAQFTPSSVVAKTSKPPQSGGSRTRSKRVGFPGLAYEFAFTLTAYAFVLSNSARAQYIATIYAATTPTAAERTAALQSCARELQTAASIHGYIATCPFFAPLNHSHSVATSPGSVRCPVDVQAHVQSGLRSLCLAEATLLSIAKDDAYMAACIQLRNQADTEWMIKAPDIPRVRTLLMARIAVRAAELADEAVGAIGTAVAGSERGECHVAGYAAVLVRVARARACRFFGIEAEDGGQTGQGIAYLRAAREVLLAGSGADREKGTLGLRHLRDGWKERRQERQLEKHAGDGRSSERRDTDDSLTAGDDAGRAEELRVGDWLARKWEKMNDTINTQRVPPHGPLLAQLPSGRDILPPPTPFVPRRLSQDRLAALRGARIGPEVNAHGPDFTYSSSEDDEAMAKRDYF
ncbi:hypothetical protein KEM52_006341 [Ascosphaera acerosa]|nr:hypothetical protein KEM52_006341 [Ascosphaera acerosa]